jgi:hypothetical protein
MMRLLFSTIPARAATAFAFAVGLCLSAGATTHHRHKSAAHAAHASHSRHHATLHRTNLRRSRHSRYARRHHAAVLGQRTMDSGRATQIQQALIRAHYLDGAPTGQWDAASQAAMQKFQADNGWQTKVMPDSRALIKLGLGPKQDDGEYGQLPVTQTAASAISPVKPTAPITGAVAGNSDAAVATPTAPSGTQD